MNKRTQAIISAVLAFSGANLVAAEKIMYKWTDSKGEVHYTERAPKGIEYTRIKTYVDSNAAVSAKATAKAEPEKATTEASKAYTSWRQENCTRANENLDILLFWLICGRIPSIKLYRFKMSCCLLSGEEKSLFHVTVSRPTNRKCHLFSFNFLQCTLFLRNNRLSVRIPFPGSPAYIYPNKQKDKTNVTQSSSHLR